MPEVALLFKAARDRPKDRADLAAVLPMLDDGMLDDGRHAWLRARLRTCHGDHPWLADL